MSDGLNMPEDANKGARFLFQLKHEVIAFNEAAEGGQPAVEDVN